MKNNLIRIKINKLFNYKDIDITFDKNLNILIGENGCGKSTILKMMNNIFNNDLIELTKVPFETIFLFLEDEEIIINYSDVIQLEESKHEEFRFVVRESLQKYNNFDEFYDYIINKLSSLEQIYENFNEDNNCNIIKYFSKDLRIYELNNYDLDKIDELIQSKKMSKCIFGSKMYLKLIFNMYNNLELKLFKFKNIKKSYYYSFVDLDEKYYQFDNIDLISKYKIIKNLKKRFVDKNNLEFKFNKDCLEVINKKTQQKIINLSSGEKKIMQLYKA